MPGTQTAPEEVDEGAMLQKNRQLGLVKYRDKRRERQSCSNDYFSWRPVVTPKRL